jgi:hypothetical protein
VPAPSSMMKESREARIGGLNRRAALTGMLCTFLVHCMHAVDGGSARSAVSAPVRQGEGTSLLLGGARIVAKASPLLDRAERALDAASMSFHQVPAVLEQKRQDGLRWLTEAREALKRGGRIKGRRDRLTLEGSLPDRWIPPPHIPFHPVISVAAPPRNSRRPCPLSLFPMWPAAQCRFHLWTPLILRAVGSQLFPQVSGRLQPVVPHYFGSDLDIRERVES